MAGHKILPCTSTAFCEACHMAYSLLGSFFHINYIGIKVYSLLRDNLAKGWIFGFNFIL